MNNGQTEVLAERDFLHPKMSPVSPRLLAFSPPHGIRVFGPFHKAGPSPSGENDQDTGKHTGFRINRLGLKSHLCHLLAVWPWVGGLTSMSRDSSFVKCMRIHLDRKIRLSYLEPKWAFTGFFLLKSPTGSSGFSLRNRGISRKRKHGPHFQIPLPNFISPGGCIFSSQHIMFWPFHWPHGKIMPVSWGYWQQVLQWTLVSLIGLAWSHDHSGSQELVPSEPFSESGNGLVPHGKRRSCIQKVGNRYRKKSKRCPLPLFREQFWAFDEIDTPVQVPSTVNNPGRPLVNVAGLFPGLGPALGLSLYVSGHIWGNRPIFTMQPLSIAPAFVPAPNMAITMLLEMKF